MLSSRQAVLFLEVRGPLRHSYDSSTIHYTLNAEDLLMYRDSHSNPQFRVLRLLRLLTEGFGDITDYFPGNMMSMFAGIKRYDALLKKMPGQRTISYF